MRRCERGCERSRRSVTDMGMSPETQVAQGRNSRPGSTGNLGKPHPRETRTGAGLRDAPVFAPGFFARTRFLEGHPPHTACHANY